MLLIPPNFGSFEFIDVLLFSKIFLLLLLLLALFVLLKLLKLLTLFELLWLGFFLIKPKPFFGWGGLLAVFIFGSLRLKDWAGCAGAPLKLSWFFNLESLSILALRLLLEFVRF